MIGPNEIIIGVLLIAAVLFIVLVFAQIRRSRSQGDVTFADALPDQDPLVTSGEFQATPIAEVIEERVRQRAADDPVLAGLDVDFGTAVDGSLEIWVDGQRFARVEDIQNQSLKEAIQEAVEEYNRNL